MKRSVLLSFIVLLVCGCQPARKEEGMVKDEGVPSTAYVVAENEDYKVFLNDEAIADSIEGLPAIKQVSLWVCENAEREGKKVLTTHIHANGSWFSMDHAVKVPRDSIPAIHKVVILSWHDDPLKLLVEGCSDYRNVQSFIINIESDSAICLPTNSGLIGMSEEEGLLIMQSYAYYEDGGRYNVIEAYDEEGNRISSMEAKIRN